MITYSEESFYDVIDEIKPLLEKHWEEIAIYKDKIKLNPNYEQYRVLQDNGMMHICTARDDSVLVGYFITFIVPNMHYQHIRTASNDILFLHPEYRKTLVGYGIIKYAIGKLSTMDVDVISIHEKLQHSLAPVMKRLGFEHKENTYMKYVGDM